jgi:RNAse (barnase) inhibitor barstar
MNTMTMDSIMDSVREKIEEFPEPHRSDMLELWEDWLETNPQYPLYISWSEFSARSDDQDELFTERRVFLKRVKNELRDQEVPLKIWQKVAKGLAAVASLFLRVFLAISRVFRVTD